MTDVNEAATGDTAETAVPRRADAKPAFGGVTVLEREEEPRDPAEHARLLELYASSFKNIAEWNYFSILLIYYLLSSILWKKIN